LLLEYLLNELLNELLQAPERADLDRFTFAEKVRLFAGLTNYCKPEYAEELRMVNRFA
jgi:hypothetical protein